MKVKQPMWIENHTTNTNFFLYIIKEMKYTKKLITILIAIWDFKLPTRYSFKFLIYFQLKLFYFFVGFF